MRNYENKHSKISDISLSENRIHAKITNSNSKQTKNLELLKTSVRRLEEKRVPNYAFKCSAPYSKIL